MKFNRIDILIGVALVIIFIYPCLFLTDLKRNPVLFVSLFAGITLASFFIKQNTISTTLFYILSGVMLFVDYVFLICWIIGIIDPNKGTVLFSDKREHVMDMTWIWGVVLGLLLTPLTLAMYNKSKRRNRKLEIAVTAIFFIVTAIIWLYKYQDKVYVGL